MKFLAALFALAVFAMGPVRAETPDAASDSTTAASEDEARQALALRLVQYSFHTETFDQLKETIFEKNRTKLREAFADYSDAQFEQFMTILGEEFKVSVRQLEFQFAGLYKMKLEPEEMQKLIEGYEAGKPETKILRSKAGRKWVNARIAGREAETLVLDRWQASLATEVTLRAFARAKTELQK